MYPHPYIPVSAAVLLCVGGTTIADCSCAQRWLSNVRRAAETGAMRMTRPAWRRRSRAEIAHQSRLGAIDFDNLPMSSHAHATAAP